MPTTEGRSGTTGFLIGNSNTPASSHHLHLERSESAGVTHIFGPDGTKGVTVHDSPVVRADMGLLGRRLRNLAFEAGVELFDNIKRLRGEDKQRSDNCNRLVRPQNRGAAVCRCHGQTWRAPSPLRPSEPLVPGRARTRTVHCHRFPSDSCRQDWGITLSRASRRTAR